MHTHTHTHVRKRIDVQIHTHMHIYTYIHVRPHTHRHIYTLTHKKCTYERKQARLEQQLGSERARNRLRPRKLYTSFVFDAIKPHFALPMQGLHCIQVLQHKYPSRGAAEPQYATKQESTPENGQSDCSRDTKGQWTRNNQPPQAAHHANHDITAPRQHPLICTGAGANLPKTAGKWQKYNLVSGMPLCPVTFGPYGLKLKPIWPSGPARGCYSLGRRFESVCRPSHVW